MVFSFTQLQPAAKMQTNHNCEKKCFSLRNPPDIQELYLAVGNVITRLLAKIKNY